MLVKISIFKWILLNMKIFCYLTEKKALKMLCFPAYCKLIRWGKNLPQKSGGGDDRNEQYIYIPMLGRI